MIRINCFISVTPATRPDVLEAAKALTAASHKEDGCKAYDIFESATRPDVLMICETWTDEAALARHMASAHFEKYVAKMREGGKLSTEKFIF